MDTAPDIVIKMMESLSQERVERVVALLEDMAALQAREDAEDIADARAAIAEYEKTGEGLSLDELDKELSR